MVQRIYQHIALNQSMFPKYITFFLFMLTTCSAVDIIAMNQSLRDGETIVSENKTFELGFFSPKSSEKRYLGIWYKDIWPRTVVWVANRETPLKNTSGVLMFNHDQIMVLLDGSSTIFWSSNFSVPIKTEVTPVALLLDTGNLVIKATSDTRKQDFLIWQSFDFPGNTYLQSMKLGKDLRNGRDRHLTSWRSSDDPSPGEYTVRWLLYEYPQIYKMRGSIIEIRLGPWNGFQFAGQPEYSSPFYTYKLDYVVNRNESYFIYTFNSTTYVERYVLTHNGRLEFWHHVKGAEDWVQDIVLPLDNCDSYGLCGPNGICNTITSPLCGCLKGFEPTKEWRSDYWAGGCQRRIGLDCGPGEGFFKFKGLKLPDTQSAKFNESMRLVECERACKNDCSCMAYANPYVTEGRSGCLLWYGNLTDVRVYPQSGQDLYVRMAASQLLELQSSSNRKKRVIIAVSLSISAVVVFCLILSLYARTKRTRRQNVDREARPKYEQFQPFSSLIKLINRDQNGNGEMGDIQLPFFSLSKIAWATNNFSTDNKLGEGGFGAVYKGQLEEGQVIAVKRLSKSSRQGLDEFKNEIISIANLQHRNLVKLLGYCIQGDETMLIYEYMPNKSLDWFIFDDSRKSLLDWPQRFRIIHGIARGLLYLHQDSRLRIVHRDLKAGNILLDVDMNPKISDFGLARMFKGHESEAKTHKVVGTLGYISPEYAVNGLFSLKSDIFSFGVMVLEIISGTKNRGFSHEDHSDNLLGHAWRLYREGKWLDLVDACLRESWVESEVLQSVTVGLLCVQRRPNDRPDMSSVVLMLGGEVPLPPPKQPGFFTGGSDSTSTTPSPPSINQLTLTQMNAR